MRFYLLALPLLVLSRPVVAQSGSPAPVQYIVSFPNAAHHELRVTAIFPPDASDAPLRIEMPRASPGRYALHEFVKNVYDVAATTDPARQPLAVRHPDPYAWELPAGRGQSSRFSYTVFADRADGTYAAIDPERAHLNLPAVLAYAPALAGRRHEIRFQHLPDTAWSVASQLRPEAGGWHSAPNLQYLMDSPVLLGKLTRRQWQQGGQTLEIALLHRGTDAQADSLAARTARITRAAERVWGTLPRYDYGRYTFLANYLPTAAGDGMEHRNSTMVPLPKALVGNQLDHLGTISHEFFHCWNVERLRPHDLEPFDFQRANMSSYLWLAEGFTMYYGNLLVRRAGLQSDDDYLSDAAVHVNQSRMPGARRFSPVHMSQQAPFVDAARSVDPTNRLNTYVSYYTLGGAVALALDLQLRARDHSLDEVMRRLWETNGQFQGADFAPQKPYTLPDFQRAVAEVAGDSAFAGQFVRRHVTGHEAHDWPALLAPAGLALQPASPSGPWLGIPSFEFGPTGLTLGAGPMLDSPLYAAGLDRGDRIESLDGRKVRTEKELTKALKSRKPGDVVTLQVSQRGQPARPVSLTLGTDPFVKLVRTETLAGQSLTESQKTFRRMWLTGK